MKRILFSLTLVMACFLATPAEVSAQTIIGYRTAVDYYGNYYRIPVYAPTNTYRPRYQARPASPTPYTRALMDEQRRREERLRKQQADFEALRTRQWVNSFKTGG